MPHPRSIAVDWSGALAGVERKIQLAEVRSGRLVRVEGGRDRKTVVEHLATTARRSRDLIVGLDFAFGFPAWFARAHGCATIADTWSLAEAEGERWRRECPHPFWGAPGSVRPPATEGRPLFRRTESDEVGVGGIQPKSVFQIAGPGSVGTGSLRGMPWLTRLRAAGFAVLPFDEPRGPIVFEIWPRRLTGRVNKSDPVWRAAYLQHRFAAQDRHLLDRAAASEDAFDATVSALVLDHYARRPDALPVARDAVDRIEGRMWSPVVDPWFGTPSLEVAATTDAAAATTPI